MQILDAKSAKRGRISSQPDGTKKGRGRPRNPKIAKRMRVDKCSRSAAYRKEEKKRLRNLTLREELESERMEFS
jgi:hypothetical protein